MVRTRPSPMCCATSVITSMGVGPSKPSLVMCTAVLMTGIWPSGNWMSTAGPEIWITRPSTATAVVVAIGVLLQSGGAAHNFDNLSGNTGLPDAIHVQRQALDDVSGIGARRFHGRHARRVLGRSGFKQGHVNLGFHVTRQQALQQFLR